VDTAQQRTQSDHYPRDICKGATDYFTTPTTPVGSGNPRSALSLVAEKRHLSDAIIIAAKGAPHSSTYITRFGSLTAAYKLIGFQPKPRYRWAETERRIGSVIDLAVADIVLTIEKLGGNASFNHEARLLTVNGKLTVSIGSARGMSDGDGLVRWHVRVDRHAKSDLALIIRMDAPNTTIQDYFLLPAAELTKTTVKRLRITSRVFAQAYRHDSLDVFYRICARGTWGQIDVRQ
jgi:hypothetical protein